MGFVSDCWTWASFYLCDVWIWSLLDGVFCSPGWLRTYYLIILALSFWSSCVHIPNPGITGIHKHTWLHLWCSWYLLDLPVSWDHGTSDRAPLVLELFIFGWDTLGSGPWSKWSLGCFYSAWLANYWVKQAWYGLLHVLCVELPPSCPCWKLLDWVLQASLPQLLVPSPGLITWLVCGSEPVKPFHFSPS